MSHLSELIETRLTEVDRMIRQINERLSKAPEGRLRISTDSGYVRYYRIQPGSRNKGKYIHCGEADMIKLLAQKDYDRKILAMLEKEQHLLRKAAGYYRNTAKETFFAGPEELVWGGLAETRKRNVEPICPDTDSYINNWLGETFERKEFRDGDTEYETGSGIRVRSKTELIIAEMLEKKKIPYHYEKPLWLKGQGIIHPDFTVLNVKERKTLYWEHLGMMDEPGYTDYALERINHYILAGYYPGRHLILTHETAARPIRTKILEKVIEAYLI